MFKRAIAIAMAFTGVVVGAGFASGQEAMQYFVAFGQQGFWGVALAATLMTITGIAILQLGSYFQAAEHTAVYDQVSGPVTSKIMDWATLVTLFSIGFVMFAGGGSNLNQQFGLPVWVGALLMLILVLATGLLDVDKVTRVIGAITPFIIVFIVGATVFTIVTADLNFAAMNTYTVEQVDTPLTSWWISALNYTGLNVLCAVSMSIVIGGNFLDSRSVGLGGIFAGIVYMMLLTLLALSLFFVAPEVNGKDLPVLEMINQIHPALTIPMTIAIFGMVFNTAVGMFYALAKRLTRNKSENFFRVYVIACLLGFALSFIGFRELVAGVYPILGYLGLIVIVVMSISWIKSRTMLNEESERRRRARALMARKLDPRKRFTMKNKKELAKLAEASNMEKPEFVEAIQEEIFDELENDAELSDFDREDLGPSVTYVKHTAPVTQEEHEKLKEANKEKIITQP